MKSRQEKDARPNCKIDELGGLDIGVMPKVGAGDYMISDAKHHSHIVSGGFGPCIALTLYDPVSKTGLLAHLPPGIQFIWSKNGPSRDQIKLDLFDEQIEMFKKLGIPGERINARLYGGGTALREVEDVDTFRKILASKGVVHFEAFKAFPTKYKDMTWGLGMIKVLDLDSGETQHFIVPFSPEYYAYSYRIEYPMYVRRQRMDENDFPIRKGYLEPTWSPILQPFIN